MDNLNIYEQLDFTEIGNDAPDKIVETFLSQLPTQTQGIVLGCIKPYDGQIESYTKRSWASALSLALALPSEDVEVNAQIMENVLEMRGMKTDIAVNGKVAVEMFSKQPEGYYDAILMDMRMPEMDGLQATMVIRKLPRADAQKIPIIALTANAFDEDVQRSLQAGLNAHLSKPVQPETLFETLEMMIP